MGLNVVTYAVSKKSAENIAEGMGAVKGAPCRVESVTSVDGGKKITLEWEGTSGSKETSEVVLYNGSDGRGIKRVTLNNNVLSITYTDGTTEEVGTIDGGESARAIPVSAIEALFA